MKRFLWDFHFFETILHKNRDEKEYRNVLLQAGFTCQVGNIGDSEQQKIEVVFCNYHSFFDKLTQQSISTQPPPPILTGTGHVLQIKRTFLIILNRTKMHYLKPWSIYQLILYVSHSPLSWWLSMSIKRVIQQNTWSQRQNKHQCQKSETFLKTFTNNHPNHLCHYKQLPFFWLWK